MAKQVGVFFLLIFALVQTSCGQNQTGRDIHNLPLDKTFVYDLHKPSNVIRLSMELNEISGLSLGPKAETLVAVQDEKGWVFTLNKTTGAILKRTTFAKDGDYEGIEYVNGDFWMVKSNGKLYQKTYNPKKDIETEKYDTDLDDIRNIEGLGYDASGNRLLLSCKGPKSKDKSHIFEREILPFDLSEKKLKKSQKIVITREAVHAFLQKKGWQSSEDFFAKMVRKLYDEFSFQPSGIAVHPQSQEIYIISFTARALLVLNRANEIMHLVELPKSILPQPEGIVIDKKGVLFISSEGKRGTARIVSFSPKI